VGASARPTDGQDCGTRGARRCLAEPGRRPGGKAPGEVLVDLVDGDPARTATTFVEEVDVARDALVGDDRDESVVEILKRASAYLARERFS
jgi:alkylation response protein AidB-like acyl-CoA dehydrogenase